jgi:hypothetical protein
LIPFFLWKKGKKGKKNYIDKNFIELKLKKRKEKKRKNQTQFFFFFFLKKRMLRAYFNKSIIGERMTDEGAKSDYFGEQLATRLFTAYPFVFKRSFMWAIGACLFMFFLVVYLYIDMSPDIKKKHDQKELLHTNVVQKTIIHLDELYEIYNFTTDQLNGFKSGRIEPFIMEMTDENRSLMQKLNSPCAAPWLKFALFKPEEYTTGHDVVNILTLASQPESLLNVFVVSHGSDTTLVSNIPFNIKDITRRSRVYYDTVTVSHTRGLYTTKDKYEAFCIQELY